MQNKILLIGIASLTLILVGCTQTTTPSTPDPSTVPILTAAECQIQQCSASTNPTCGSIPAGGLVCTQIYRDIDTCLGFVKCEISNNTCQTVKDEKYASCYQCFKNCENIPNSAIQESQQCAESCRVQLAENWTQVK